MAVSGSDLFVVNYNNATVGEYTTSGNTVAATLLSGFTNPIGIAVSGSDLFVSDGGTRTIGEYTTSGGTVDAALITGLNDDPYDLASFGSALYLANSGLSTAGWGIGW